MYRRVRDKSDCTAYICSNGNAFGTFYAADNVSHCCSDDESDSRAHKSTHDGTDEDSN